MFIDRKPKNLKRYDRQQENPKTQSYILNLADHVIENSAVNTPNIIIYQLVL